MSRHSVKTILLATLVGVGISPAEQVPPTTIYSEDPAQVEMAHWAIGRFEDEGLNLPSLEIHFHDSKADCGGNHGSFNPSLSRVLLCVDEPLVVLHELAHAWAREELTDEQRAAYVEAGGFESWSDSDTAWNERGSEDAADTIAWALLEQPITSWTPDGPIARRADAYRLLTGTEAPRLVVGA